jgi:hypothetical protein
VKGGLKPSLKRKPKEVIQMISIPVRLWIPSEVKILDYHVYTGCSCCTPTVTAKFETPIFEGEIEAEIYANGKIIEAEEGKISGRYKYSSPLEWTWNNFEFSFRNPKQLEQIFQQILSGKILLEEAQYRKTPPEDLPPELKNGYGEEIYNDILNAYKQLFSTKELAQKYKEQMLTLGG